MAGPMVQVQTQQAIGSGSSVSVTLPNPVTVGNRIIIIAASRGSTVGSRSMGPDSLGNLYNLDFGGSVTPGTDPLSPDSKILEMYSTAIVTGGSCTITYNTGVSDTNITLYAQEWSGLYPNAPYGGGPGAAWIDTGFSVGAAPFPPFTLHFATDYPALAAFYGTTLPLIAIIAAYDQTMVQSFQVFPNASGTLNLPFPTYPLLDVAIGICMLYVGSIAPVTVNCSITIGGGPLLLSCSVPPPGVVGVFYSYQVVASGGVPPYTFSVVSGSLPPGLTLNASTGVISGIPTTAGAFSFVIQVMDSIGDTATCPIETITITILPTGCTDPNSGSGLQSTQLEVAPPDIAEDWWTNIPEE